MALTKVHSRISNTRGAINAVDYATSGSGTAADRYIVPFDVVDAAAVDCKTVFIPAGAHVQIASPPFIMTNTLTLYGEGETSRLYSGATAGEIAVQTPDSNDTDYLSIRDLTIEGEPAAGGGVGLWINDTPRWGLHNVIIKNHSGGGLLVEGRSHIGEANNCFFLNTGGHGVRTLMPDVGDSVLGIEFISCTSSGNTGAGYNINSSDDFGAFGMAIIGGTIEQNVGKGIIANNTSNLTIDSVYIEANTTAGIDLTNMSEHNVVNIRNLGRGSIIDMLIGDCVVNIDGFQVYENGLVLSLTGEGSYEVTNFVLLPSDTANTAYISEESSLNKGVKGLGNLLKLGNFVHWGAGATEVPSGWRDDNTATYAQATPPTFCSGKAVQVTAVAANDDLKQFISNIVAGMTITVSVWAKVTAGDTARIYTKDNGTGQQRVMEVTSTTWKRYTIQHLTSPGTNQFYVSLQAKNIGDIVFFSEVQATRTANLEGWLCNVQDIDFSNIAQTIGTLPDDATPSVLNGEKWLTGGTTGITDFDDGVTGQTITIMAEHSVTITDGTNIFLSGSTDFAMTSTDTLTLVCKADGKWYEISRSDNT